MPTRLFSFFILILSLVCSTQVPASDHQDIKIAYITQEQQVPAALSNLEPFVADKGLQGALLGLKDSNTTGQFTDQNYLLEQVIVPIGGDVKAAFTELLTQGVQLIVVNLAAAQLEQLDQINKNQALLFDVATRTDAFRHKQCLSNVLHLLPSRAMRADALAQYMLKKRWNRWFLVQGNTPEDALYAQAIKRSAKRFGMKIVAEKKWLHTYDARRTAQSDIPVFTQVDDYDVLIVADEQGLFGEYISYRTWLPRPVIGTQGLVATAWHRTHEQWGAVQIQNRFKAMASRQMQEQDYAAYLAVRAIGEAVTRTRAMDAVSIKAYLLSADFKLQGYKGRPLSFRSWNGQLRQPVLLAAPTSLVTAAPLEGFLHPNNELDSLGYDQPETQCQ
ncbi:branched-chain amino acid ABC transporter substrate-binding protein [Methylococcaceae bacterium HT4]|nr:branched-chain amino acid ABC transporter substrate-binding protein [Methylococcaceae bacterium CS5]TXL06738.1 branched-chain amino acid ABC transporter substrate-binding protein [Methylococcaceae bacterium CS3]TXL10500.1 branched-chain amino acid ABC transporter substrate-binding protein [Methylococcaceae bacterium CS2]TXL15742.1 branched-chain amino acid ABC transporter substrate-binding protein [Methylococcaceae bacterium HT4]TXL20147.1 branched-chain amino acid ABC transporter substrate-